MAMLNNQRVYIMEQPKIKNGWFQGTPMTHDLGHLHMTCLQVRSGIHLEMLDEECDKMLSPFFHLSTALGFFNVYRWMSYDWPGICRWYSHQTLGWLDGFLSSHGAEKYPGVNVYIDVFHPMVSLFHWVIYIKSHIFGEVMFNPHMFWWF